jgi:hypothetical protein
MQGKGVKSKMYQNMQNYYQYPYNQQYQRLAQMEQQQQIQPQYPAAVAGQSYIKGRPVVSIEEARASQIDLDGSLFVFTDIGNKKIYTKQINLDGTATLNTYSLVENVAPSESYVTKTELESAITALREEMEKGKEKNESTGDIKKPTSKQPSF